MASYNCGIQTPYFYPCRAAQGGVKEIYLGVYNDTAMTYSINADRTIDGFGGIVTHFYTISQRQEQASMNNVLVQSIDNGSTYWEQTVEIVIEQVDVSVNDWLRILSVGQWRILVLDNMGNYWMVGLKNGAYMTASSGGPRKMFGDGKRKTITFTAKEPLEATMVDELAALQLI